MVPHVGELGSSPGGVEDLLLEQRWIFVHEVLDEHEGLKGYDLLGEKKIKHPKI